MVIPVRIETQNGTVTASVAGWSEMRVDAPTREAAMHGLRTLVAERIGTGELAVLDVGTGVSDIAGIFRDDPTLREICEEAYRLRDAETLE